MRQDGDTTESTKNAGSTYSKWWTTGTREILTATQTSINKKYIYKKSTVDWDN